jgi:hypothetical protein
VTGSGGRTRSNGGPHGHHRSKQQEVHRQGKPTPKKQATGSKAKPRAEYTDEVKAIATRARAMACPVTKQGPVPRQVQDVQRVLKDPRAALKQAGLTQKQVKEYAQGSSDKELRAALRPLGQRVVEAGGAKQWVTGRPLASTLVAWLEQR